MNALLIVTRGVSLLTVLLSSFSVEAALPIPGPAPDDQEHPAIISNGDGYFAVWADKRSYGATEYDIYGARIAADGRVLDPDGILICGNPGRQTSPRVAFDGTQYLVVWEDDRESTTNFLLYQIYGARVTADGQVLDPDGFKMTTNRITRTAPAVASNGEGFFAVWVDWHRTEGAIADIYGSPVSSAGVVANPDGIPLKLAPFWQVSPHIASANGDYFVVFYDDASIRGMRLSSSGAILAGDIWINGGSSTDGYGVASNGRDYFVAWGDHRNSPSGFGWPKIYGTLVRSNGLVANPGGIEISTSALSQGNPSVGSDGSDFLVAWEEYYDINEQIPDVFAARITRSGSPAQPGTRIPVNRQPGMQMNVDIAFSGTNYLVAWQDSRTAPGTYYPFGAFDVYGTLVSQTGAVLHEDGFAIATQLPRPEPPVVNVVATDADAAEAGLLTVVHPGEFTFSRSGDATEPLTATFTLSGTAINGVDYIRLTNRITFACGANEARVQVVPLYDQLVENTETAIVTLEAPICAGLFPLPPDCYRVGGAGRATVLIADSPTTNRPPEIEMASPQNGTVFPPASDIALAADASDPDGRVVRVKFYAVLLSGNLPTTNLVGTVNSFGQETFSMVWSNVTRLGTYDLFAVAMDNRGASAQSDIVRIRVADRGTPCPPVIGWQANFGTPGNDDPRRVYGMPQGGYVLGGATYTPTNQSDIWLVRFDGSGNKLWERFIGGVDSEYFGDLKPLADGGLIVGGSRNVDGDYQYLMLRINADGNVLWERMFGGAGLDLVTSVTPAHDGGFLLAGQSDSPTNSQKTAPRYGRADYWLVRVNGDGDQLWDKSYGGTQADHVSNLISLNDGGFLVAGASESGATGNKTTANFGQEDAWVLRLDAAGDRIWEKTFGGSQRDAARAITISSGGFLLTGWSASPPSGNKTSRHFGNGDAWALRLTEDGTLLWEQTYGGFANDYANAAAESDDGGFILGGNSVSDANGNKSWPRLTSQDIWVVGIRGSGEKIWDRAFGGAGPQASWLEDIIRAPEGGYVVAAESYVGISGDKTVPNYGGSDAWVFKLPPTDRDCDGDGVIDIEDRCPDTDTGATVDARGCAPNQRDSDLDGVTDDLDRCPATPADTPVDRFGCSTRLPVCPPDIEWQQTHARDDLQGVQAVRQMPDGGFLFVAGMQGINGIGTNAGFGRSDALVVRTDARGDVIWERIFGGTEDDNLGSLVLLPDGGALLAGYSTSGADGNKTSPLIYGADAWLVRVDAQGNKVWDKTFDGGEEGFFYDIQSVPDGGFVLAGSTSNGHEFGWLLRLDAQANVVWEKRIAHEDYSWFNRVLALPDGGFMAGGVNEDDDGNHRAWLARLNASGAVLWESFYEGCDYWGVTALLPTDDGGFLLGCTSAQLDGFGRAEPIYGGKDFWLLRVDADGTRLWDRSYGGGGDDELRDMVAHPAGGFVLGGNTLFSSGGNKRAPQFGYSDQWIVRIDESGAKLWDAAYGGELEEYLGTLVSTTDGGLLLAGSTASNPSGNKTAPRRSIVDNWLVKLDSRNGCDTDGDGVPNDRDQCPETPAGTSVNGVGCGIAQLCHCDGPWRNHSEYVRCVMGHAWEFYRAGIITADQRRAITQAAVQSNCGRRNTEEEDARILICPQTREECDSNGLRIVVTAQADAQYSIESSTDLIHWTPVAQGEVVVTGAEIAFPVAAEIPARFFRVRTQTNP